MKALRRVLWILVLASQLSGQAAMQLERRAYRHLEQLRAKLLSACLRAGLEEREEVAKLLAEDKAGSGYVSTLRALAMLAGEAADRDFINRAGMIPMVLPDVVDPEVEAKIHSTMYAPRRLEGLGRVEFQVVLEDSQGEEIERQLVAERTSLDELLRFRPTTSFDLSEQEPGEFQIRLLTELDDAPPRPWDLALAERFLLLPGFAARVRRIEERIASLDWERELESFGLFERAIISGGYWQLHYILQGDPAVPGSDPLRDLQRLEAMLDNMQSGQPALVGLEGRMTLGLPAVSEVDGRLTAAELAQVSVDLPSQEEAEASKPLILFVAGRPVWSHAYRPTTPKTRRPEWLLDQLQRSGFDADSRYHLAVMESAGRYEHAGVAVSRVLVALLSILPVTDGQVILVGEREGAWAVGRAVGREGARAAGLVLVNAAAIGRSDLKSFAGLSILGVTGWGHPGNASLFNLGRLAEASDELGSVRILPAEGRPWPIALAVSADEIEAFANELFSR